MLSTRQRPAWASPLAESELTPCVQSAGAEKCGTWAVLLGRMQGVRG